VDKPAQRIRRFCGLLRYVCDPNSESVLSSCVVAAPRSIPVVFACGALLVVLLMRDARSASVLRAAAVNGTLSKTDYNLARFLSLTLGRSAVRIILRRRARAALLRSLCAFRCRVALSPSSPCLTVYLRRLSLACIAAAVRMQTLSEVVYSGLDDKKPFTVSRFCCCPLFHGPLSPRPGLVSPLRYVGSSSGFACVSCGSGCRDGATGRDVHRQHWYLASTSKWVRQT
jgi:hypothetical protein